MMQKVHSGVVVHSEGMRVRIEGIDLKVREYGNYIICLHISFSELSLA